MSRHRGNKHREGIFKMFSEEKLEEISPKEVPKKHNGQRRQSCAKEPRVVWRRWRKVSLVVTRARNENRRKEMGLKSYFHARHQHMTRLTMSGLPCRSVNSPHQNCKQHENNP